MTHWHRLCGCANVKSICISLIMISQHFLVIFVM
jgi:hypothetical protein